MYFSNDTTTSARSTAKRVWVGATLVSALLANATAVFADILATPVGIWQTIDDRTHQPTALVQITQNEDGTLSGKVIRGLGENNAPQRRCAKCTDERKDQQIQGMTIVREMKQDNDDWDGGSILDPVNGREYRCKMHLEAGGQRLIVRGYIGVSLLGRSQTWTRYGDGTGAAVRD